MSDAKYKLLKCLVVTPDGLVVDIEVAEVIIPTVEGKVGVLSGHAPMLCELKPGVFKYKDRQWDEYHLFVDGGFAHVRDNEVIILTPAVIKPGQVEALVARKALEDAFAMPSGMGMSDSRRQAIDRAHQIMFFVETHKS